VTIDGVPHFHAHFIPRSSECTTRGVDFLKQNFFCSEQDAAEIAHKLKVILKPI
jgi:diadenosine tetraphosphate (Ap4A) HIT family hydrolase